MVKVVILSHGHSGLKLCCHLQTEGQSRLMLLSGHRWPKQFMLLSGHRWSKLFTLLPVCWWSKLFMLSHGPWGSNLFMLTYFVCCTWSYKARYAHPCLWATTNAIEKWPLLWLSSSHRLYWLLTLMANNLRNHICLVHFRCRVFRCSVECTSGGVCVPYVMVLVC